MQSFFCTCGKEVFFENTQCLSCKKVLGFDSETLTMLPLVWNKQGQLVSKNKKSYKYCKNYDDFSICNWVLPSESEDHYCKACELNELIPQVTAPEKRYWWYTLEQSKRRLIYTLLKLKLPIVSRRRNPDGLAFAFLEDSRMNPEMAQQFVNTGHAQGLITINLAEADDIARESTRIAMGESYRTLLGHFRHESGHYYFDQLIKNTEWHFKFKDLFGDDLLYYQTAVQHYYDNPPPPASETGFISDYAQSHPLEDWAECWAHYFHIVDTLETAKGFGLVSSDPFIDDIDTWLEEWPQLTIIINRLNRSLGLKDAYPFNLSEMSIRKLHFVHQVIGFDPKS